MKSAWLTTTFGQVLAALTALVLAGGCLDTRKTASREWAIMGTFASVSVPAAQSGDLDRYVNDAKRIFAEINDKLTVYSAESELSALNRAAGSGPVALSARTGHAVAASLKYAALSDGYFDPTVAPLVRFWGFNDGTPPSSLPPAEEVSAVLKTTGYTHVRLAAPWTGQEDIWHAELTLPGMSLDLGGVAKGLAVDVCFERLQEIGASDVMVNLGGNIRCGGSPQPCRSWRIGVRNPFNESEMLGVLEIPDGWAVATSGNYERYVVIEGKRYAHIINPRTGHPVEGMAGVTVIADTAVEADAMSTAFFVMGPDEAGDILPRVPNCRVLLVKDEQPLIIWVTPDFSRCFTPEREFSSVVRVLPN